MTYDVGQLLDRMAIHDVTVRYCRGIDRLDVELVRSAYHDDAVDDHGLYRGSVAVVAEQIVDSLREQFVGHSHMIANQLIEMDGRQAADVETYFLALHIRRTATAHEQSTVNGRYLDRFEKRLGDWRIARRVVVYDGRRVDPIPFDGLAPLGDVALSRRDRTDPSYRRRR